MTRPDASLFEVDGRCKCNQCVSRTGTTYWMVGGCHNCRTAATILIEFRRGDKARAVDCPACGCSRTVHPSRLATSGDGAAYASEVAS